MYLDHIAIRRLRVVPIPEDGQSLGPAAGLIALADLAGLGFRITNLEDWDDRLLSGWSHVIIPTLTAMRGDGVPLGGVGRAFSEVVTR
jgi:hypothetical protein